MSNVNTEQWNQNSLIMQESRLARWHRQRIIGLSRFHELITDRRAAILDLGCGSGFFLREFHTRGYRGLYGIEPDRALMANIPPGIAQVRDDKAEAIGFASATFDAVFVYGVLHHLPDLEVYAKACREMDRVLKPGGRIFIMEPGRLWVFKLVEWMSGWLGPMYPPLRALRASMEEERKEQEYFIEHHAIFREFFQKERYRTLADRYFLYTWIFTAQKPA
ncbi:MAG: class I SAM-dependent methyltransferase [Magnetococcales bacterium]|nr:class I SAM-dependent methyltransferase [Magnetococcales bacterium]